MALPPPLFACVAGIMFNGGPSLLLVSRCRSVFSVAVRIPGRVTLFSLYLYVFNSLWRKYLKLVEEILSQIW